MTPVQPVTDLIGLIEETKNERGKLWFNLVDVYEKLVRNITDNLFAYYNICKEFVFNSSYIFSMKKMM